MESLKEKIIANKNKVIIAVFVAIFVIWMLRASQGDDLEFTESDFSAELAQLQAERSKQLAFDSADLVFDGQDELGISVTGGGDGSPRAFETGDPLIVGRLVGFGTKTDAEGEYLLAYVKVAGNVGYEVDLRPMLQYSLEIPPYLQKDTDVRVYGEFVDEHSIRARVVQ